MSNIHACSEALAAGIARLELLTSSDCPFCRPPVLRMPTGTLEEPKSLDTLSVRARAVVGQETYGGFDVRALVTYHGIPTVGSLYRLAAANGDFLSLEPVTFKHLTPEEV